MNNINVLQDNDIEIITKQYSKEFKYKKNHVSIYKNDIYSIILYKNDISISELRLQILHINFQECFKKIQTNYNIVDNLIIVNKMNTNFFLHLSSQNFDIFNIFDAFYTDFKR